MMDFFEYTVQKLYQISEIESLKIETILKFIAVLTLVFLLELFFVGWEKSSLKRVIKFDKTIRTDIFCSLFAVFNLYNLIAFILSLGFFYFVTGLIQKNIHLNYISYIDNPAIQYGLIFIASDFKLYVSHLIFHRNNFLWKTHEFHHSATTLSIITRYRSHFLETAINTLFDATLYVILGVPVIVYIYISLIIEVHKLFQHSSIKSDWGLIGKYILVSPAAHRVHHSIETEHYNKNFGATLIIWDRLFGTYHPGIDVKNVGIPNNPYNKKGFLFDVWLGMKNFIQAILKK